MEIGESTYLKWVVNVSPSFDVTVKVQKRAIRKIRFPVEFSTKIEWK